MRGLDQYQIAFAREKVQGYFLPRPQEESNTELAFLRARQECAQEFRKRADEIELLKWEDFKATGAAKATGSAT